MIRGFFQEVVRAQMGITSIDAGIDARGIDPYQHAGALGDFGIVVQLNFEAAELARNQGHATQNRNRES